MRFTIEGMEKSGHGDTVILTLVQVGIPAPRGVFVAETTLDVAHGLRLGEALVMHKEPEESCIKVEFDQVEISSGIKHRDFATPGVSGASFMLLEPEDSNTTYGVSPKALKSLVSIEMSQTVFGSKNKSLFDCLVAIGEFRDMFYAWLDDDDDIMHLFRLFPNGRMVSENQHESMVRTVRAIGDFFNKNVTHLNDNIKNLGKLSEFICSETGLNNVQEFMRAISDPDDLIGYMIIKTSRWIETLDEKNRLQKIYSTATMLDCLCGEIFVKASREGFTAKDFYELAEQIIAGSIVLVPKEDSGATEKETERALRR